MKPKLRTATQLCTTPVSVSLGVSTLIACLGSSPAWGIEVLYTRPGTEVTLGLPYGDLEFDNPLEGDETVAGCEVVEWRDAGYPGYEDWTVSHPWEIDGYTNEIWLRWAGHSATTTTTVPTAAVSIHLHGDYNDGIADVFVDGVLVATVDMYTATSDRALVLVTTLANTFHTIEVSAAGSGGGGYDDVAIMGAAALRQCYNLDWYTVDNGGLMLTTGSSYGLSGTIGQPDAGTLTGGAYVLNGGFWRASPNPPNAAPAPHDRRKNRALSFLPNNEDVPVAFQIELTAVGSADCYNDDPMDDVGMTWWITEPVCTDGGGQQIPNVPPDPCTWENVWRSQLVTTWPGTIVWPRPDPEAGDSGVVHVADCEVIPAATYEIIAYDGFHSSASFEIGTILRPTSECWGDCVGMWDGSQWTPPNEVVNMDDVMAAVTYFTNDPNKPHRMAVEIDDETVNMVFNMADIFRFVEGFKGNAYPFSRPSECPAESGKGNAAAGPSAGREQPEMHGFTMSAEGGGRYDRGESAPTRAAMTVVPAKTTVHPGEPVAVEVYASEALDVAVYEVAVDVSGGALGQLTPEDLFVDAERGDFVFAAVESLEVTDETGGRLGGVTLAEPVDASEPRYLGTFVFRASADAAGTFYVNLRGSEGTFMRDARGEPIPFERSPATVITVESTTGVRWIQTRGK